MNGVFIAFLRSLIMLFIFCSSVYAANNAIWIWETESFRMLDNNQSLEQSMSFLKSQDISTLYLYADEYHGRNVLIREPEKYRKLIKIAHENGFKIYALLGSYYLNTPEYILPEKRRVALQMFENVLIYNKNAETESQFDGINLDIEPYLLDDWSTSRPLRGPQYLELSKAFMELKEKYGSGIQVGPAIPFWFSGITDVTWNNQKRQYNEWIQDIYDYVAIMDYRNKALGSDSMVSLSKEEFDYADKINKKVMIGVETIETTPEKITFYGMGIKYFKKQLALAKAEMIKHKSFGGFVIHHYESYEKMVEENK